MRRAATVRSVVIFRVLMQIDVGWRRVYECSYVAVTFSNSSFLDKHGFMSTSRVLAFNLAFNSLGYETLTLPNLDDKYDFKAFEGMMTG